LLNQAKVIICQFFSELLLVCLYLQWLNQNGIEMHFVLDYGAWVAGNLIETI